MCAINLWLDCLVFILYLLFISTRGQHMTTFPQAFWIPGLIDWKTKHLIQHKREAKSIHVLQKWHHLTRQEKDE